MQELFVTYLNLKKISTQRQLQLTGTGTILQTVRFRKAEQLQSSDVRAAEKEDRRPGAR